MAEFITVGRVGVNPDAVTCAEWVSDPANPQVGTLHVNLGAKDYSFPFDAPGVPELAAAVGLEEFGAEWVRVYEVREAAKAEGEPKDEPAAERKHRAKKTKGDEGSES